MLAASSKLVKRKVAYSYLIGPVACTAVHLNKTSIIKLRVQLLHLRVDTFNGDYSYFLTPTSRVSCAHINLY